MSAHSRFSSAARRPIVHALAFVVSWGGLAACSADDRAGRQPIGAASDVGTSSAASVAAGEVPSEVQSEASKLPLAALTALEAGNTAYREKRMDEALVQYARASEAAPAHAAPWFGIYMAAVEMKNSTLADSAMRRVKALSADPAALDAHATVTSPNNGLAGNGALPPGHPSAATPVLPEGHPTTSPALPPGHPAPSGSSPSTVGAPKKM